MYFARMRFVVICLGTVTACHCPMSGAPSAKAAAPDVPLRALESLEIFAAGVMRRGPQGRTLTGVSDFGVIADSGQLVRDGR
jgi:hypothetical protein